MQRDIVFRGKRTDNGQWVEGYYFTTPLTNENIMVPIEDGHYFMCGIQRHVIARNGAVFEVDRDTVGQYTELPDKNGKRIFEGDVIELINADYEKIRVVCEFGTARRQIFENIVDITGFYFKLPSGKKSFPIVKNYAGKHDLELYEVIGNIHDNPEMIGGAI